VQIALDVCLHVDTVRKWRRRFAGHGVKGLDDLPRSGRPTRFTPVQVAQVKALACSPPADHGLSLSRWSVTALAAQSVAQGLVEKVSPATVSRWLASDAIKPWQHRSWIFPPPRPRLRGQAARVLDLYARTWEGRELCDDEYVISADEKSQLQALWRRHPGQPAGPGRPRRVEFEYARGGTLTYLAACAHQARVMGTIAPKTGIEPLMRLVEQVTTTEPHASAKRYPPYSRSRFSRSLGPADQLAIHGPVPSD